MPALIQGASKFQVENVSGTIQLSMVNTAGNLLVAVYHPQQAVGSQTFGDTLGNVWQTLVKFSDPFTGELTWFLYVPNCKGGTNVFAGGTQAGIPNGAALAVFELSVSALDVASGAGAISTSGSPANCDTANLTTVAPNDFAFAVFCGEAINVNPNTYNPGAGWAQVYYQSGPVHTPAPTPTMCSFFAETNSIPNAGTVVSGKATTQAGYSIDNILLTFKGSGAGGGAPRLLCSLGVGV